jgi:hypothetical protein
MFLVTLCLRSFFDKHKSSTDIEAGSDFGPIFYTRSLKHITLCCTSCFSASILFFFNSFLCFYFKKKNRKLKLEERPKTKSKLYYKLINTRTPAPVLDSCVVRYFFFVRERKVTRKIRTLHLFPRCRNHMSI